VQQLKRDNHASFIKLTVSHNSTIYGEESAVQMAIEILRKSSISDESTGGPFLLKYPDLSFQNILVNDDFKVVAVLGWNFASIVTQGKFGYFLAPATSRLSFLVQKCEEEVIKDREYFLACLEEERMQHRSGLDLTLLFESEYSEMALYLAAVELNRPKGSYLHRLAHLVET
jgi:hypothetical protein